MGAGRIPDAVKHRFVEMLESPSGFAKFKKIMAATRKEDSYLKYFIEAMDRVYGKPDNHESVELDVSKLPDEFFERVINRGTTGEVSPDSQAGK